MPRARNFDIDRGSAFHLIVEYRDKGLSDAELRAALDERQLHPKAEKVAWGLYEAYSRQYPKGSIPVIASEVEFDYQIPGSPHSMVGKIDQILSRSEKLWVGEMKTANSRKQFDRVAEEWRQKKQADFEIVGARHLGYAVEGVFVRTIKEGVPPIIWEIEEKRSDHRLRLTELSVHQTCETILMYEATFGIDKPWPHLPYSYPCSMSGKCEYESICGQDSCLWTPEDLEGFQAREEHLELFKQQLQEVEG